MEPAQYRVYASERARPVFELLARIDVADPHSVVDLGRDPGERTADLAARCPAPP
jgi:trans-aconitate 2-methyltransferase